MRAPGARGPQRTRRETSGVPRTRLLGTRGGARPGVCGRRLLGASGTTRTPLLGQDGRSGGGSGSRARPCSGEPAGYGDRRVTAGHRLGHGVCAAAPGTEQSRALLTGRCRRPGAGPGGRGPRDERVKELAAGPGEWAGGPSAGPRVVPGSVAQRNREGREAGRGQGDSAPRASSTPWAPRPRTLVKIRGGKAAHGANPGIASSHGAREDAGEGPSWPRSRAAQDRHRAERAACAAGCDSAPEVAAGDRVSGEA